MNGASLSDDCFRAHRAEAGRSVEVVEADARRQKEHGPIERERQVDGVRAGPRQRDDPDVGLCERRALETVRKGPTA